MRKENVNKKEHSHIRKERYMFCIRGDTYKGRGLHVQTIVFVSHSLACVQDTHKDRRTQKVREKGEGNKQHAHTHTQHTK